MMMKAIRIHEYGNPDVLKIETVPVPQPAPGQVQIKVRAIGINPVDWKTRKGQGIGGMLGDAFPMVIGWDVSGVVAAVGKGVENHAVGDDVYGMVNFPTAAGAYAGYVVAPATHVAPKPSALSYAQAAALPLVTLTAWQALFDAANLQTGQRILIHAAAGGVGHVAVQLAKSVGAQVIGTASANNETYLRELGVDSFIDYRTTDFAAVLADNKVDVVLDTIAGETRTRSLKVLKPGGILVSILGDPSAETEPLGLRSAAVFVQPDAGQLKQIATMVDAHTLSPTVSQTFPFDAMAEAHRISEQGHVRGKLVVTLD